MNIILFDELLADNHLPRADFRASHIRKVLRLKEGDNFSAGVKNGVKGIATVTAIDGEGVGFTFAPDPAYRPELYPVTLMVAQVRPICMRRILREAVSLGVRRIFLCGSDTTEKSYGQANLYKSGEYRTILADGAMQSGETGISECRLFPSFDRAIGTLEGEETRIVLDNVLSGTPLSAMDLDPTKPVVLAIGPERGYSDRERDLLVSSGFRPATLGSRILRTETACSAGLAVLLGRLGLL